jgi:hypothetical protein
VPLASPVRGERFFDGRSELIDRWDISRRKDRR